jgi:hypothetical protein
LAVFVVEGVAHTLGQSFDRFGETQGIDLLEEGVDVTALTAAETVVEACLGSHVKAWRALIVERAQALHGPDTGGFQRDVFADNIGNVYPLADLVNIGTPDATSHAVSLVLR